MTSLLVFTESSALRNQSREHRGQPCEDVKLHVVAMVMVHEGVAEHKEANVFHAHFTALGVRRFFSDRP